MTRTMTMLATLIAMSTIALARPCQPFTSGHSTLARVTVYWHGDGSGDHASSNGARLRESHCAVDPKKIPYGSKVVFPDAACVAVDCGTDVVNRKAARLSGRNVAERNAIVIDRFFETKQKALAWAKAHPHFMTVQILTTATTQGTKLIATENPRSSPRNSASSSKTSWARSAE
jgi:3D (Asp-Asp-Asp) domain-containing protein